MATVAAERRPAVAGLQTLDRGQRRVFDCGQGEAVFDLRRRGSREEGGGRSKGWRQMQIDREEEEAAGRG